MQPEDASKLLDQESNKILWELQEALDAIDIVNEEPKKNTNEEAEEDDDPESDEHELSLLMDSLVAELRADLQTETVQEQCKIAGSEVPKTNSSTTTTDTEPSVLSQEFDVPVSDFTQQAKNRLTPTQKELLQRLRYHISQKQTYKNRDVDRVYQEIPDYLESSENDNNVQFEIVRPASRDDPDYVPVQDFSPPPKIKKKQQQQEDEPFVIVPQEQNENNAVEQSQHQQQQSDQLLLARQENADRLEHYFTSRSREEEIVEKLAKSQVWKRICRIVFREDMPDGELVPPHKTRLVE